MTSSPFLSVVYVLSVVSVLSVSPSSPSAAAQHCPAPPLLPAYAHNDYYNPRPLHDAVALGYRGVEADVVLVGGRLLVGHSRKETDSTRTLESLYLEPMRALIGRCSRIYPDSTPFLLTIESKDKGAAVYGALRRVLLRYSDILSTMTAGGSEERPVQVVLVGWHPPLQELAAESTLVAKAQGRLTYTGARLPEGPRELVGLLSLNYGRTLRWRGRGVVPNGDRNVLARVAQTRHAYPGVPLRAYNVPPVREVYELLLSSGVDLIGTSDLRKTAEMLRGRGERAEDR